jgi:hypothetical protein
MLGRTERPALVESVPGGLQPGRWARTAGYGDVPRAGAAARGGLLRKRPVAMRRRALPARAAAPRAARASIPSQPVGTKRARAVERRHTLPGDCLDHIPQVEGLGDAALHQEIKRRPLRRRILRLVDARSVGCGRGVAGGDASAARGRQGGRASGRWADAAAGGHQQRRPRRRGPLLICVHLASAAAYGERAGGLRALHGPLAAQRLILQRAIGRRVRLACAARRARQHGCCQCQASSALAGSSLPCSEGTGRTGHGDGPRAGAAAKGGLLRKWLVAMRRGTLPVRAAAARAAHASEPTQPVGTERARAVELCHTLPGDCREPTPRVERLGDAALHQEIERRQLRRRVLRFTDGRCIGRGRGVEAGAAGAARGRQGCFASGRWGRQTSEARQAGLSADFPYTRTVGTHLREGL